MFPGYGTMNKTQLLKGKSQVGQILKFKYKKQWPEIRKEGKKGNISEIVGKSDPSHELRIYNRFKIPGNKRGYLPNSWKHQISLVHLFSYCIFA